HSKSPDLLGDDLVFGPLVLRGDGAVAAAQLLRDGCYLLFTDVAIVTVEGLPRDGVRLGLQEQTNGLGDVRGMDLLAAGAGGDRFAPNDLADQVKPTGIRGRMSQPVNAGRPQSADRPALSDAIAVDELLQSGLVGSVRTGRPKGVSLVQSSIVQDHFMNGAG